MSLIQTAQVVYYPLSRVHPPERVNNLQIASKGYNEGSQNLREIYDQPLISTTEGPLLDENNEPVSINRILSTSVADEPLPYTDASIVSTKVEWEILRDTECDRELTIDFQLFARGKTAPIEQFKRDIRPPSRLTYQACS